MGAKPVNFGDYGASCVAFVAARLNFVYEEKMLWQLFENRRKTGSLRQPHQVEYHYVACSLAYGHEYHCEHEVSPQVAQCHCDC